ncbi:MAG: hypothetical protein AAB664_04500 [Patescibacteria group bacterium]
MSNEFLKENVLPSNPNPLVRRWREVDGVIYLTVTLDKPTTGDEWTERMEKKGNRVDVSVKRMFFLKNFTCSTAGMYEIVILKGLLFEYKGCITQNIHAKASEMKLVKPNADIACLIREQLTDEEIEEMGLMFIVTMHEPIEGSNGRPCLLTTSRYNNGRWLNAHLDLPGIEWEQEYGFAFLAP